jgi:hypothetical protein
MTYQSLDDFLRRGRSALAKGPVALIFVEDDTEIASTASRLKTLGFAEIVMFLPAQVALPADLEVPVHVVSYEVFAEGAVPEAVNAIIAAASEKTWIHYCYNAEYFFFPYCESRSVGELIAFNAEERRDAMMTYVVDLYAGDLALHPDAVDLDGAMMDTSGYCALARYDADGKVLERQLDFFGGIRWRFEEHIPWARRHIDRISLFRAQKGLKLGADHRFNIAEYNTYACPWHHNVTGVVASFRTAKALKSNPGSKWAVQSFLWNGSARFDWSSLQLMELGLMEPGQWF